VPATPLVSESFANPGSEHRIVQSINFTLHPAENVVLTSGDRAGKIALLKAHGPTPRSRPARRYRPREYASKSLRREIGVIFQDYLG
jgi:ABC-type phosphate/phosphonate transport system ATPase subunit